MKTGEMITEITKDMDKRFKNDKDGWSIYYYNGKLLKMFNKLENRSFSINEYLHAEWTEIIEPVDTKTAMLDWLKNGTEYFSEVDDTRFIKGKTSTERYIVFNGIAIKVSTKENWKKV